jgi:Flp pilus assembly protein TadD
MSSKLFWFSLFCLFFLIAAVLYSPSLSGPWQYDDYAQILDEKVLTGRSLPLLLSSTFMFQAHPDGWTGTRDLVRASFLANWQWWGKDPAGYRWVNLLIHVINATLVVGLVYLLLSRLSNLGNLRHLSIFSGLLFLIHPLNSQAVAYVAQRFTSMATMFYLGAIVAWLMTLMTNDKYIPMTNNKRKPFENLSLVQINHLSFIIWYSLAIISALLAFNSKEIAVTLPVVLLLLSILSNLSHLSYLKKILLLLPFFLLSLKIPFQIVSSSFGNTISMDKVAEVAADSFALKQKAVDLTRHDYFLTQINVVGTYLRLAILPVRQTLDYDYPLTTALDLKTVGLGIFHLSLISAGIWLLLKPRRQMTNDKYIPMTNNKLRFAGHLSLVQIGADLSFRLIGLGLLWFYLTLLPESSVVPIADLIYEHRTYLPMVGLVIALAGAVGAFFHETHESHEPHVSHAAVVAAAIMLILSAATMRRAYIWGNEVRLWGDIYEKAPNKPRANKNYGVVLAAAGKYEEGVKRLARAVELEPENADYWSNFGTAYLRWGKYEEASGKFLKAYELFSSQKGIGNLSDLSNLSPKDLKQAAQYMNDYGVAMVQSQHADEALAGFEKALKIDPTLYASWLGLGAAYNLKGDSEMSIKIFTKTVNDFPTLPDGYNNLAIVLKKAGRTEEAAAVLSRMPKK